MRHSSERAPLREGLAALFGLTPLQPLGDVLYEQERYDEAEAATRTSEEAAAADDMSSQVIWRSVRAKVLARKGRFDGAERLARDALALVEPTDYLDYQAATRLSLADVLRLQGRNDEAAEAVREAVQFFETKGNLVSARRATELLEQLASEPVAERD